MGKRHHVASNNPELGLLGGEEAVLPLDFFSFLLLYVQFVVDCFLLVGHSCTLHPLDARETLLVRAK